MTVFVIRDTLARQTCDVTSTFTSCILNYLNNRFHCSPNNSLLSFSANDWLKFVAVILNFNSAPDWMKFVAAILNFNSTPDWLKFQVAILDLENIRFHSSPNNCLLPFSAPDWLKFQVAILDLENIRFHSSPNNCLLPFSAPDWLLLKPSGYTTMNILTSFKCNGFGHMLVRVIRPPKFKLRCCQIRPFIEFTVLLLLRGHCHGYFERF